MKHAYAIWRWKKGKWFAFELYLLAQKQQPGPCNGCLHAGSAALIGFRQIPVQCLVSQAFAQLLHIILAYC